MSQGKNAAFVPLSKSTDSSGSSRLTTETSRSSSGSGSLASMLEIQRKNLRKTTPNVRPSKAVNQNVSFSQKNLRKTTPTPRPSQAVNKNVPFSQKNLRKTNLRRW